MATSQHLLCDNEDTWVYTYSVQPPRGREPVRLINPNKKENFSMHFKQLIWRVPPSGRLGFAGGWRGREKAGRGIFWAFYRIFIIPSKMLKKGPEVQTQCCHPPITLSQLWAKILPYLNANISWFRLETRIFWEEKEKKEKKREFLPMFPRTAPHSWIWEGGAGSTS